MNEEQAKKAVIAFAIVTISAQVYKNLRRHGSALGKDATAKQEGRKIGAIVLLAAGLGIFAGFSPEIAGPLALFLMFAVLISLTPEVKA